MAADATKERKILFGGTIATVVAFLFQLVAICTSYWLLVDAPSEQVTGNKTGRTLIRSYSGLWRICKVYREGKDGSESEVCESHDLFPSEEDIQVDENIDSHYLDYTRTVIAFTIIAILLMSLVHCFAFYTIRRPRYIVKRLTALLHFMTAACILVLNEVFVKAIEHEKEHLAGRFPINGVSSYGFSFILSWLVFVVFVCVGLVFLFVSHKRKADMADIDDELAQEDEPMQLGRV
ncbi:hypothetical protein LOTGIDRAFT_127872 [Lottia gigantea]|uniref:Voltage-dependent calcium channel gamma-1 subunit n=1 Tax=Lottia gigantea TaxID=225164 RepID=V4BF18_LOTGI|nr:hypothetical protein LOTGIDRAFT_127872 [Lottia gigantea]ESO87434.1 hypothetical protein LOTGIDRAFT_127872 [Lottia gigantea]